MQQMGSILEVSAEQLRESCTKTESQGLASELMRLIDNKQLLTGTRLPTVRSFAASMGLSLNTIAATWSILRNAGYIETYRRGGTYVMKRSAESWHADAESVSVNLSHASGDPALRPDLSQALSYGLAAPGLHGASLEYIIPSLKSLAIDAWPFAANDWMIAGASSESILLAVSAVCEPGMSIAVEQPTSSRLLKILSLLRVNAVGVPWDEQGPSVEGLQHALDEGVVAFIYQPRSHLPLGRTVTAAQAKRLANVLRRYPDVKIIEDDPLGPLSTATPASVGCWLPDQTVLVRSFCKAYGLDLRTSIIGGNAQHIAAIRQKRSCGLGMISRILQGALYYLLTDSASLEKMEDIRRIYAQRRHIFQSALREQGIRFDEKQTGLLLWVPVDNEARVIASLAQKNILVCEGSRHFIAPAAPHIAINITNLPSHAEPITQIAREIAASILTVDKGFFD
ncbi:aminotransferase class I/II-fold pyridoxal phosphate-dependent enzyme [Brenneria corticis]|uniref:GntR family transcriptional regulator n=1 Tax=Brenneria corticis TaxID=2173106 RepID=A0A2U1UCY2_9GAMM|nr:aminotransferase class I/II-fold pyridoxal phosphate-dependent enzyme [Brenneria sp. CFCC 11842]PWC19533.1 GntR family transcriptional regulator [Brenneria sp. CFCC 11842]